MAEDRALSTLLGSNDDDPNGVNLFDSYLELDLGVGSYMVVIGPDSYSAAEALVGESLGIEYSWFANARTNPALGEWTVTVTSINEVPVPAAFPLFLSALVGLGFLRRK